MEIPNYKTLAKLPSGSTISLFNDTKKIYNVAENEIQTKILMPQNTNLTWDNLIENDRTYWFTMVTKDEYNSMLDSNKVIDNLPGTMTDNNRCQQLICVPNTEEVITMAAFHMSEGHIYSFYGQQCHFGVLSGSAQFGLPQWPEADKSLSAWTIGAVFYKCCHHISTSCHKVRRTI